MNCDLPRYAVKCGVKWPCVKTGAALTESFEPPEGATCPADWQMTTGRAFLKNYPTKGDRNYQAYQLFLQNMGESKVYCFPPEALRTKNPRCIQPLDPQDLPAKGSARYETLKKECFVRYHGYEPPSNAKALEDRIKKTEAENGAPAPIAKQKENQNANVAPGEGPDGGGASPQQGTPAYAVSSGGRPRPGLQLPPPGAGGIQPSTAKAAELEKQAEEAESNGDTAKANELKKQAEDERSKVSSSQEIAEELDKPLPWRPVGMRVKPEPGAQENPFLHRTFKDFLFTDGVPNYAGSFVMS